MALPLPAHDFEILIADLGRRVMYAPAVKCPCRGGSYDAADPACPLCMGRGYFHEAEVGPLTIGATNMATSKKYQQYGEVEQGDLALTLPAQVRDAAGAWSANPAYTAAERDRFVLTDGEVELHAVLTKGTQDTLPQDQVVSITTLGAIVGGLFQEFTSGVDYTLVGATIQWIGNPIADGDRYTVRYRVHPTYYVYRDLAVDRSQEGGEPLCRRVQARLMELWRR